MAAKATAKASKAKRPLGVTILACLHILVGIIAILAGIYVAKYGRIIGTLALGAIGTHLTLILLIIGLLSLVIAYGFIKGAKWSWWVAIILYAIGIIIAILSIRHIFGSLLRIIIYAILIFYLTRPRVKKWFNV